MKIYQITLYTTPFDSSYSNVPSSSEGVKGGGSIKADYLSWLQKYASPTTVIDIYAEAFADNITEKILIKIADTKTIRNKNYAVLVTDDQYDGDKFYFITSYKLLNAMSQPTIELSLTKDIWTECYDTAIHQNNANFLITKQHLNMIGADGNVSEDYQNIENDSVGVVTFSESWGSPVVLWAVYKCDPTVTFYTDRSSDHKIGPYAPNPTYGTYKYFYYAVGLIRKGYVEPIGRPYDGGAYSLYFPRVDGSYLLSQQLTAHVPFDYTLVERSGGGYNVYPGTAHNPIFFLYGTTEYRCIDSWGADYDRNEFTEFCYYNEDTDTSIRQYHYSYTPDISQNGDYYNSTDNIQYSPYMQAYPFKYYTLTLPGGKEITFDGAVPLKSLDIYITPTDSGGNITLNAVTCDNNSVFIKDETFINFECTGDIPSSINAYLDYMSRAGATINEQKQYALNSNTLRTNQQISNALYKSFQNTIQGTVETAGYALTGKMTNAVTSGLNTAIHMGDGAVEAGNAFARYKLEKDHINDAYSARMADLGTTTVTKFQASNQLNTSPFWDMPVVYKHVVINNHVNRAYQLEYIKYGVDCQKVDNPLNDYRYSFNFVKAVCPNYTSIGNTVYRDIFNSILSKGVTKWNIGHYKNNVLDWFVENNQM